MFRCTVKPLINCTSQPKPGLTKWMGRKKCAKLKLKKTCDTIWKRSSNFELAAERKAAHLPEFVYLADIEVCAFTTIHEYLST